MSVRSLSTREAYYWARSRSHSHLQRSCWDVRYNTVHQQEGEGASAKLSEDVTREDAEAEMHGSEVQGRRSKVPRMEHPHENWCGEESLQDTVLRMLVDKYKPLRTGIVRTADEKLKDSPPQIRSETIQPDIRTWKEIANEPLLPAVEGHKPWHTTFKAPSHTSASIKFGSIELPPTSTKSGSTSTGSQTARTERELLKRKEQASRLTRARESTLDYRLGLRGERDRSRARVNPATLAGWQSLAEKRIEEARIAGVFDKVRGRGQLIARLSEERNPFIARDEFLMNRIVQRNGAAPPWVEVQIELESAVNSFRETLRRSWTRRVVRMLTLPTCRYPSQLIDSYVNVQLNSLVRKYNAVAPYAVRRPYYAREVELEKAYEDCGEEILRAIKEKREDTSGHSASIPVAKPVPGVGGPVDPGSSFGFRALILQWIERLLRKFTGTRQP
ncbi:hypothetical protein EDC04DRAFT_1472782 [Pisolithus marmoratus]|nr:hypothetical protein EDC04DRAFT_1472782 [Pisolithus marmoratus]